MRVDGMGGAHASQGPSALVQFQRNGITASRQNGRKSLGVEDWRAAAEQHGAKVVRTRRGIRTQCLAHGDENPSLDIDAGQGGQALVRCRSRGCKYEDIATAFGLRDEDAGRRLPLLPRRRTAPSPPRPAAPDERTEQALSIWRRGRDARGTLAERYLRSRGLELPETDRLRFVPELLHAPSGTRWPGLLGLIARGHDDVPLGVHRTFLAPDGRGKARIEPARMVCGPCGGGAVRLAPHEPERALLVGEGIETVLAAMQATGLPGWAAISAGGLQGLMLPPDVHEVVIVADGDDAGETAARAAAERWAREGRRASIARMPRGLDANDVLLGREVAS
jgi:putative DNA primase/helicase